MSGIKHLSEILSKKGISYVSELLDSHITITEKMDAAKFSIKRTIFGFEYYKRGGKIPINKIDRTLSMYFESAINHFDKLSKDVEIMDQIPLGMFFTMYYFVSNKPMNIHYDILPKNKMMIHSIKDDSGEYIQNNAEIYKWTTLLKIDEAPIIFDGKLSKSQKSEIIDFIKTPRETLSELYTGNKFSEKFIPIFSDGVLSISYLQKNKDKHIEGFVFKVNNQKAEFSKIIDPSFNKLIKGKGNPGDVYGLIVSDITSFILGSNFDEITLNSVTSVDKYIEIIEHLFYDYIKDRKEQYIDIDFGLPNHLLTNDVKLNQTYLRNDKVINIVNENQSFSELFKIFLATFRKEKKKAYGYFTEEFINNTFNTTIQKINSKTEISKVEHLNINKQTVTTNQLNKVNVIVGDFQPLDKSHIGMVKYLKNLNGLNSILVQCAECNTFSEDVILDILTIAKEKETYLDECFICGEVSLVDIITDIRLKGYEPTIISTEGDKFKSFNNQLNFLLHNHNNIMDLEEGINIVQTPRIVKTSTILVYLKVDFKKFRALVPTYVYKFRNNLKQWV